MTRNTLDYFTLASGVSMRALTDVTVEGAHTGSSVFTLVTLTIGAPCSVLTNACFRHILLYISIDPFLIFSVIKLVGDCLLK